MSEEGSREGRVFLDASEERELRLRAARCNPNPSELASLAGALFPQLMKQKPLKQEASIAATLQLWKLCESAVGDAVSEDLGKYRDALIKKKSELDRSRSTRMKPRFKLPKKFPVSLDEFLKLVVGGDVKTRKSRFQRFISYRLECDLDGSGQKVTAAMTRKHISDAYTRKEFDELSFMKLAGAYETWFQEVEKPSIKAAAGKAGGIASRGPRIKKKKNDI